MTPTPPKVSRIGWVLGMAGSLILAFFLCVAGFEWVDDMPRDGIIVGLFGLLFLASSFAIAFGVIAVGLGLWRRPHPFAEEKVEERQQRSEMASKAWKGVRDGATKGMQGIAAVGGTVAEKIKTSKVTHESDSEKPRTSNLAFWAFGLATVGWVTFGIGPLIGCVLGWIALRQHEKSDKEIKGLGFARFAALQVPVLIVTFLLGAAGFFLWERNFDPFTSSPSALGLAALVFLANSFLFRLGDFRGSWSWNRNVGMAIVVLAALLLCVAGWAQWENRGYYHDEFALFLAGLTCGAGLLFALCGFGLGSFMLVATSVVCLVVWNSPILSQALRFSEVSPPPMIEVDTPTPPGFPPVGDF